MKIDILSQTLFYKSLLFIGLIITINFPPIVASPDDSSMVEAKFKQAIIDINQTLSEKQQSFALSPELLVGFVDDSLLTLWSSTRTLKGLFGRTIWKNLGHTEKAALTVAFNNTLQRYVQEGFKYYDGQQFEFVSLKLNKKQTRGYLTVKFIPHLLPSFNIKFKIGLIEGEWFLYDALFEGVSYIALKKHGYREIYKNQNIIGVLDLAKEKNKGFLPSQRRVVGYEGNIANANIKNKINK